MTAAEITPGPGAEGTRLAFSSPLYGEIMDFLIDEAALLDRDLMGDWLELLTPDIRYRMPVRRTVSRDDGEGFDPAMMHFDEYLESLRLRVARSSRIDSYSSNPPSRTRRLVTNLVARTTSRADEFEAITSELLTRSSGDRPAYDLISARREDLLRRDGR
jgi:3-phenylpropionate/cinnamic acid dioxygenase small subunit